MAGDLDDVEGIEGHRRTMPSEWMVLLCVERDPSLYRNKQQAQLSMESRRRLEEKARRNARQKTNARVRL